MSEADSALFQGETPFHVLGGIVTVRGFGPVAFLALLGSIALSILAAFRGAVEETGRSLLLFSQAVSWMARPPYRIRELVRQMDAIGVQSVELICITGAFTGMVMALQSDIALSRYRAEGLIGAAVALSLARELGPVLTALMVVGRAGSAIAAELGTMRSTEQIDALSSMAVEPVQYLVVPRIVAAILMLPLLTILFEFFGMMGAYFTVTLQLGIDWATFMTSVREYLQLSDITHGLFKSVFFGLVFSLVSCTKGFYVTGGAVGVAKATTRAVVISSLFVLASDYFLTAVLF
jgi:phospholipid/cholesterol/gamma-HCH transport system permease protein